MPILPIDTGRYGSPQIKRIFEERERLQYQLEFEAAVAKAQAQINMIPVGVAKEIVKIAKSDKITLELVGKLEAISEHDTAAVVEALSEKCSAKSKPWIHYGLTSNDIVDTTISMQMRDVFRIIEPKILRLALILADRSVEFRAQPAVGRTHGQHTSIIAFGLKFAVWAAEMATHIERIEEGKKRFLLCKTLGVVGTGSLMGKRSLEVQRIVAKNLSLHPVDAATQVIPRERIAEIQFLITLVGCTLDKIATEVRNLQRTEIGEVAEHFRKGQMGSSAVPVKRNPIRSEKVSSLARLLRSLIDVALENIPLWHERDLSNSANERFTIPMAAILLDEMLDSLINVIFKLKINTQRLITNLDMTKGQIYSEFVLDALVKKGVPRITAYRDIQRVAFSALQGGQHFRDAIKRDSHLVKKLSSDELQYIFTPSNHLGASSEIIDHVVNKVRNTRSKYFDHNSEPSL
ncbi:MAG TPA: adenylosuccinate lyase [Candidatus Nitrosopolaris sp.]|nr:adenylosuccinate lyase [Candidatus Nitrosopolaris sp.]